MPTYNSENASYAGEIFVEFHHRTRFSPRNKQYADFGDFGLLYQTTSYLSARIRRRSKFVSAEKGLRILIMMNQCTLPRSRPRNIGPGSCHDDPMI